MCKSQTPKPVLGQTLKFDPPFFSKLVRPRGASEAPRARKVYQWPACSLHWPPAGGSLPVAPAQGLPGAQAGGNLPVAPAGGLCFSFCKETNRPRWEDGSLPRHHLLLERHGRRPRRLSWEIPLLRVCQAIGLSPWALRGHASLRATVSRIDIGSGEMRQRHSECST